MLFILALLQSEPEFASVSHISCLQDSVQAVHQLGAGVRHRLSGRSSVICTLSRIQTRRGRLPDLTARLLSSSRHHVEARRQCLAGGADGEAARQHVGA